MSASVIIYGKENCPHTRRARDAYPEAIYHDVLHDPAKLNDMLTLSSGVRRVPVIVKGTTVEVGHRRGS